MEDVGTQAAAINLDEVEDHGVRSDLASPEIDSLIGEVISIIHQHTGGRVHKLEVEVQDAIILLRGFCATFHCNQLAQAAAMSVAGDLAVDNQIVVW